MSRLLSDLAPEFQPIAYKLLALFTEAGIPTLIVDTLRTPAEQAANLASGASKTLNSRHLTGHAIDVAPYEVYQLHGPDKLQWNSSDPVWLKMGLIGESLGLVWGGRWKDANGKPWPDSGHFEMKRP